jgi:hypothetical protein
MFVFVVFQGASAGTVMKFMARIDSLKRQMQRKANEDYAAGARPWVTARAWVLGALCLLLAGVGTLAYFEFTFWNKIPPALAGVWEVSEGPRQGDTFEFTRNGTLETNLEHKKQIITHKNRVVLKGKTLWISAPNLLAQGEQTRKIAIRELTAQSLILELDKGELLRLMRTN